MNTTQKLPSDALKMPARRAPWIIGGVCALAIATAAVIAGPSIAAHVTAAPTPSPTLNEYVSPGLSPDELASVQQGADAQRSIIAADEAAAAAAQAAADAAAKKAAAVNHHKCPAGSQANSADASGDTSCFPVICFHITVPDLAHPECDTAFKP